MKTSFFCLAAVVLFAGTSIYLFAQHQILLLALLIVFAGVVLSHLCRSRDRRSTGSANPLSRQSPASVRPASQELTEEYCDKALFDIVRQVERLEIEQTRAALKADHLGRVLSEVHPRAASRSQLVESLSIAREHQALFAETLKAACEHWDFLIQQRDRLRLQIAHRALEEEGHRLKVLRDGFASAQTTSRLQ